MRSKLIIVYASLVVLMGALAFGFVRQAVNGANRNTGALAERARQESSYVASRIEVAALAQERWLSGAPLGAGASEVMQRGTPEARGDAATAFCDSSIGAAAGALGMRPALALMVDAAGKIVGRNGSSLSRGEDLGAAHPMLKASLASGAPGSEVWFQPERNEQFLVSFAPTFGKDHAVVGALVLGVPLTDVLNAASNGSSASTVALVEAKGEGVDLAVVRGQAVNDTVRAQLSKVGQAGLGSVAPVSANAGDTQLASVGLVHLGSGKATAVVVTAPEQLAPGVDSLPYSLIGLFALLLVMTIAAGWLLGGYIQKPIEELEEGLLAILNGQHDKRFQMEHAELGGLSFRIDQLLNQLMGVEEDNTDDEGRVVASSRHPLRQYDDVQDNAGEEASLAERLKNEAPDAYYERVYREYIDAKRAIGEDVSHITAQTFRERIQSMEAEALGKHGRPVRYQVKRNGNEIVLLAIPI